MPAEELQLRSSFLHFGARFVAATCVSLAGKVSNVSIEKSFSTRPSKGSIFMAAKSLLAMALRFSGDDEEVSQTRDHRCKTQLWINLHICR